MATARTPAQNRAIYQRRKALAAARGETVYSHRDAAARSRGWSSYNEERRWRKRLTDEYIRELAVEIGGPVEPERPNALMSRKANDIVNPRGGEGRPADWRIRLLRAAGKIPA